jgi:hypothetical protein
MILYYGYNGNGHNLYAPGFVSNLDNREACPWSLGELERLLPKDEEQVQGVYVTRKKNGWTAVSFWDRTGDSRLGSKSVFVVNTDETAKEVLKLAKGNFPSIFARLQNNHIQLKDAETNQPVQTVEASVEET